MEASDSDTKHTVLSPILTKNGRGRLLQYLVNSDTPQRQKDIAATLDVNESTITRAKQPLVTAGLIEELDDGRLSVPRAVRSCIEDLEQARHQ